MPRCLLGENILHVDADMGGAVRQGTERKRFQRVRVSAVLAQHGFDNIGDRRQFEWLAQERGIHSGGGFGDRAFGE